MEAMPKVKVIRNMGLEVAVVGPFKYSLNTSMEMEILVYKVEMVHLEGVEDPAAG
jgi:hypothetical protein